MRRFAIPFVFPVAASLLVVLCLAGCSDLSVNQDDIAGEDGVIGEHGVVDDSGGDVPGSGGAVEEEEDATGPIIVDEEDATGPIIVTGDALDHVGETVTVTGVVVAVDDLGPKYGKYIIRLDSEKNGEGFNVVLSYENADDLDLHGLFGTVFGVTGKIYENASEQKGEIEVTDPSQVDYPIDT